MQMHKELKKNIILSYIFIFGYTTFLLLVLSVFNAFSSREGGLEASKIAVIVIGSIAFIITALVFIIKSIILTYKLKYETEFILMVVFLASPYTYIVGSIMVLLKIEKELKKLEEINKDNKPQIIELIEEQKNTEQITNKEEKKENISLENSNNE